MAKLKFHKDFTVREKGKDRVIKAGVHEIKDKASVTRWIRRGCTLVESKGKDEDQAKKDAEAKAKAEAEAKAKKEAEEKAKAEAEAKAKAEAEKNKTKK